MAKPTWNRFFVTRFLHGFFAYFDGLRFLLAHRSLVRIAAIPWLVSTVIFVILFFVFRGYTAGMVEGIEQHLDAILASAAWWTTIVKPFVWIATFLLDVLWYFLLVLVVSVLSFLVIGNLIAGPFYELLAEATEKLQRGALPEDFDFGFLEDLKRIVVEETKRTLFFLGYGLLFWIGSLIPGVNVVAVPLGFLFGVYFIGLNYMDTTMERRHLRFREKRAYFAKNRALMFGFGLAITLVMMVPVLNILSPPICVVAATLLFLEMEKGGREEAGEG